MPETSMLPSARHLKVNSLADSDRLAGKTQPQQVTPRAPLRSCKHGITLLHSLAFGANHHQS